MKPALIDTDILSLFLRSEQHVVRKFGEYLNCYAEINLSLVTRNIKPFERIEGLEMEDWAQG